MAQPGSVYATDHHASVLRTHSRRTAENSIPYLLPHLSPTMKLLDVGCGPGSITVDLAKRVPQGHVTGIEYMPEPLEVARSLAASQGVQNVDFQVGDIHELPFEDGSFDIVHVHQVLQHVRDPVKGLREMKRVCKKGGLVAVRESAGMKWFPQLEALDQWKDLHTRVSKAKGGNPDPGSWIHVWAKEAGFKEDDVRSSAGSWCFSGKQEREWWSGVWVERVLKSSFGEMAVKGGHCERQDLERIAEGWREWGGCEDAWFGILHGEILCQV